MLACLLNCNNTRMPGMALAVTVQLATAPNMHSYEMPTHLSQFTEQCLMHLPFNTIEWLAPCMWTTHINYINMVASYHQLHTRGRLAAEGPSPLPQRELHVLNKKHLCYPLPSLTVGLDLRTVYGQTPKVRRVWGRVYRRTWW